MLFGLVAYVIVPSDGEAQLSPAIEIELEVKLNANTCMAVNRRTKFQVQPLQKYASEEVCARYSASKHCYLYNG